MSTYHGHPDCVHSSWTSTTQGHFQLAYANLTISSKK
nr:MAG TPA: hypothetical protein [Caudoviricetes sp.]